MTKTKHDNYTAAISVKQSTDKVFDAVNNVRGWWSEAIEGNTDALGAVFKFHYKDLHRTTHKITEFVPGKKVVWHITESQINFVKDKAEWKGTDVVFESPEKATRPSCASPTSASCRRWNATASARAPGASTSTKACAI